MARTLLAVATVVWLVAGVVGLGIGLAGSAGLQRLLPPLAIDVAALGGAVVAVSSLLLVVGAAHAAVLLGLRTDHRQARSWAILLSGTLAVLLLALAASAATSAATLPDRAVALLLAAAAAAVGALAYGLAAALLVAEVRSRRAG